MRHFVLLKYEEDDYLTDEVFAELKAAYEEVAATIDGVDDMQVFKNCCFPRETNMNVMVSFDVKDEETLKYYLGHPLHRAIAAKNDPHVKLRVTFDHL